MQEKETYPRFGGQETVRFIIELFPALDVWCVDFIHQRQRSVQALNWDFDLIEEKEKRKKLAKKFFWNF